MGKPRAVCKDMLSCFHLAMATQTLGALCREKALSVLPNGSIGRIVPDMFLEGQASIEVESQVSPVCLGFESRGTNS